MAERNFCLLAIVIIALQLDLSFCIPLVKDASSSGEYETLNLKKENSVAPLHQMADRSSAHLIRKKRSILPLSSVTDQEILPLGYGTAKTSFYLNSEITNTDASNELTSSKVVHQENSTPSTKQISPTAKFVHPVSSLKKKVTEVKEKPLQGENITTKSTLTVDKEQLKKKSTSTGDKEQLKTSTSTGDKEQLKTSTSAEDKEQLKTSTSTEGNEQLKKSKSTGDKEQQKSDGSKDNITVEHKVLQIVNTNIDNVISPSEATESNGKLMDSDTRSLLTNYLNTEKPTGYSKISNSDGIDTYFINETDALKPIISEQNKSDLDRAIPISDMAVDIFWINFFSNLDTNYTISTNQNFSKEGITLLPVNIELTTKFSVENAIENSTPIDNKNELKNLAQKAQGITEFSTEMTAKDSSNTNKVANKTRPLKSTREGEISIPRITEFTSGITVKDYLATASSKAGPTKLLRESKSSISKPTSGFTTDLSIKSEFAKDTTVTNKKELLTMSSDVSSSPNTINPLQESQNTINPLQESPNTINPLQESLNTINPLQEPKLNHIPLSRNVLQILELNDIFNGIPLLPIKFVQVDKSLVQDNNIETTTKTGEKNILETGTTTINKKTLHKPISEDVSSTPKTDVYQIFKLKPIQLLQNGLNLPEIKEQVNSINLPTEMLMQETKSSIPKAVKFTTVIISKDDTKNTINVEDGSKSTTKDAKTIELPKMEQVSVVPEIRVESTTAMTSKDGSKNATKDVKKIGLPKMKQESVVPLISVESTTATTSEDSSKNTKNVAKKSGLPKLEQESVAPVNNVESTTALTPEDGSKIATKVAKNTGLPKLGQESVASGITTEFTTDITVKSEFENSTKPANENIIQKDASSSPLIRPVILQMSELQDMFNSIHAPSTGVLEQKEGIV